MKRILYILTLLFAVSCNWLEITPENTIDEDDLFTTGYGFRNALNGIYLEIGSSDLYGENLSWGFLSAVAQEYLTDNSYVGSYSMQSSKDAAGFVYNSATTQPVISSIWEKQYSVIANINKIIEHIDDVDKYQFAYAEDERNLIKAEAYALRAMLHFDLLRLFAPAPSTNPSGTYIPYRETFGPEMGEKLSVTSFLEKCLKDITVAEPLLKAFDVDLHPEAMYASMMNSVTPTWNSRYRFDCKNYIDEMGEFFWFRGWRMNYMSLLALKARICMYAGGSYKSLARAAAKSLYDEFYTQKGWIGFNAQDEITCNSDLRHFKLATDVMFAAYNKNLATDYDAGLYGSDNNVRYPLANVESLFATDNTGLYSDYRLTYITKSTNAVNKAYYTGKWSVSAEAVVEAVENPMIPLFRFSEICYILAELSAENGKYDEAIQYLTDVRKARGAERSITASTKEEIVNEIVAEVRKDMMTEGQVFYLYKRLNMPTISSSTKPGTQVQMSSATYVLPIPTSESPF